MLSDKLIFG